MKKILLVSVLACALLFGCSNSQNDSSDKNAKTTNVTDSPEASATSDSSKSETSTTKCDLEDGTYTADFKTDSTMFRVSEACNGKGTLTVKNGQMTIHVSLGSKNIVNLYVGLAEDAKKNNADLLYPTTDTVTYSDGMSEEVYGFDIPVKAIDEEFDLAIIGTKNKWYDHKVSVTNPIKE